MAYGLSDGETIHCSGFVTTRNYIHSFLCPRESSRLALNLYYAGPLALVLLHTDSGRSGDSSGCPIEETVDSHRKVHDNMFMLVHTTKL